MNHVPTNTYNTSYMTQKSAFCFTHHFQLLSNKTPKKTNMAESTNSNLSSIESGTFKKKSLPPDPGLPSFHPGPACWTCWAKSSRPSVEPVVQGITERWNLISPQLEKLRNHGKWSLQETRTENGRLKPEGWTPTKCQVAEMLGALVGGVRTPLLPWGFIFH